MLCRSAGGSPAHLLRAGEPPALRNIRDANIGGNIRVVSFDRRVRRRLSPKRQENGTVIGRELADRLRDKIALLPPREGTVFCLRYFDDLSYQEIADLLTITPGAVAAALCKARTKLEAHLLEVPDERIVEREPERLPVH